MTRNSIVQYRSNKKESVRNARLVDTYSGKDILYIEDDHVNFLYFNELISGSKLHVIRAVTLAQALIKLSTNKKFSLIVLSASIPENRYNYALITLKIKYPEIPILLIKDRSCGNCNSGYDWPGPDMNIDRRADSMYLLEAINELIGKRKLVSKYQL